MKKLSVAVAIFVFLFLFFGEGIKEAEAFKWREAGCAPLMPGFITDEISLCEKLFFHKEEIIQGLRLAEPEWDSIEVWKALVVTVKRGNARETVIRQGTEFWWMIFKGRSGVSVIRDVEWVGNGNESLEGFVLSFFYKGKEPKFFIPKKCGNISLMKESLSSRPESRSEYCRRQPDQPPIIIYQDCGPHYSPPPSYPPPPPPQYYYYSRPPSNYESFSFRMPLSPPLPFFFGGYVENHHHHHHSRPQPPRQWPPAFRTR